VKGLVLNEAKELRWHEILRLRLRTLHGFLGGVYPEFADGVEKDCVFRLKSAPDYDPGRGVSTTLEGKIKASIDRVQVL
jgi:hypothetical protein